MLKLLRWFLRYDQVVHSLFLSLLLYGVLCLFAYIYGDGVFDAFVTGVLIALGLCGTGLLSILLASITISWLQDIVTAVEAQRAAPPLSSEPTVEAAGDWAAEEPQPAAEPEPAQDGEVALTSDPDEPIEA
jgi:hypothetical protein